MIVRIAKCLFVLAVLGGAIPTSTLKLKFQAGRDVRGNSGLQFRSRYDPNANGGWMDGPQVDIHPPADMSWRTGFIYDETRGQRHWLVPNLMGSNIDEKVKPARHRFKYSDDGDGWNELVVICRGTKVRTVLNGIVVADWDGAGILDDAVHQRYRVGSRGHFALQIHRGSQVRIRFKDILVREI